MKKISKLFILIIIFTIIFATSPVFAFPDSQEPTPDLLDEANSYFLEGGSLFEKGDYSAAFANYNFALELFKQINDYIGVLQSLYWLGRISELQGNNDLAIKFYEQSFELNLEGYIKDHKFAINTASRIGDVLNSTSQFEESYQYLKIAIEISEMYEETDSLLLMYKRIVDLAITTHRLEAAIYYLFIWLDWEIELGNLLGEAIVSQKIAQIYFEVYGDKNMALSYLSDALDISQYLGDEREECDVLLDMAAIYNDISDYQQRDLAIDQALRIAWDLDDPFLKAKTHYLLAFVNMNQEEFVDALSFAESSLEFFSQSGNFKEMEFRLLNQIGNIYQELDQTELSLLNFSQALNIARQSNDFLFASIILGNIGFTYESMGEDGKAIDSYYESLNEKEKVIFSSSVTYEQISLKNVSVYMHLINLLSKNGRSEEAFIVSEKNRASSFFYEILDYQSMDWKNIHGEFQFIFDRTISEIIRIEEELFHERKKPAEQQDYSKIDLLNSELIYNQETFDLTLTDYKLSLPQESFDNRNKDISIELIQNLLDDDTTIISYYHTEINTVVFLISRQEFNMVILPVDRAEIVYKSRDFLQVSLSNLELIHSKSLLDLYDLLIAPLLPYIKTSKLGFVPHFGTHFVPFAALSNGEDYLGDKFSIFILPAVSYLPYIHDGSENVVESVLILGNPKYPDPSLPNLFYASDEAKKIADLFNEEPLLNSSASESNFYNNVDNAGIIHLVTHSEISDMSLFSKLWLSSDEFEDGRLFVYEIYQTDFKDTNLIVLSGCETQGQDITLSDDVIGLSRPFLIKIPSVIASMWAVDDQSTGYLMAQFYSYLLDGMGKAEALQAAQKDVRTNEEHAEWAHPYYWAAFVLNGDPGPIKFDLQIRYPFLNDLRNFHDGKLSNLLNINTFVLCSIVVILIGSLLIFLFGFLRAQRKAKITDFENK